MLWTHSLNFWMKLQLQQIRPLMEAEKDLLSIKVTNVLSYHLSLSLILSTWWKECSCSARGVWVSSETWWRSSSSSNIGHSSLFTGQDYPLTPDLWIVLQTSPPPGICGQCSPSHLHHVIFPPHTPHPLPPEPHQYTMPYTLPIAQVYTVYIGL